MLQTHPGRGHRPFRRRSLRTITGRTGSGPGRFDRRLPRRIRGVFGTIQSGCTTGANPPCPRMESRRDGRLRPRTSGEGRLPRQLGGNANPYEYCTADPINCTDLNGKWSWKNALKRTWHIARAGRNAPVSLVAYRQARRNGGKCVRRSGLMIECSGMKGGYYNGGTTYGNVWMRGKNGGGKARLRHETKHADQWAILGPFGFATSYGVSSGISSRIYKKRKPKNGCTARYACYNIFERGAGLRDGGYTR